MQLEVWADVVCPWCYIGKRRLEAAVATFRTAHPDEEISLRYRAFELDPTATGGGAPLTEHLAARYGTSIDQAEQMQQRVTTVAEQDGLHLRLDLAGTARTFDAHRLVQLARATSGDHEQAMVERLFAAYFTEGAVVDDHTVLASLADDVGLSRSAVAATLSGDDFAATVREDEATAARLGIRGVPCFVVDRHLATTGAQPAAALVSMLEQAVSGAPDPVGSR